MSIRDRLTTEDQGIYDKHLLRGLSEFRDCKDAIQFEIKAQIRAALLTSLETKNKALFMANLGFLNARIAAMFAMGNCKAGTEEELFFWSTLSSDCVTWLFEVTWAFEYLLPEPERDIAIDLPVAADLDWETPLKDLRLWAPQDHIARVLGGE